MGDPPRQGVAAPPDGTARSGHSSEVSPRGPWERYGSRRIAKLVLQAVSGFVNNPTRTHCNTLLIFAPLVFWRRSDFTFKSISVIHNDYGRAYSFHSPDSRSTFMCSRRPLEATGAFNISHNIPCYDE